MVTNSHFSYISLCQEIATNEKSNFHQIIFKNKIKFIFYKKRPGGVEMNESCIFMN